MKAVIFDLDNTLYNQNTFAYSAFRAMGRHLERKYGVNGKKAYAEIRAVWDKKGSMHRHLFDDAAKKLKLRKTAVRELVEILHNHRARIKLRPSALYALKKLGKRYKIGIITSGNKKMQANKINVLGLGKIIDGVVYSAENGGKFEKPHPNSYIIAAKKLSVSPKEAAYVGDNPYMDFEGAKKVGMHTIRVKIGWFKNKKVGKKRDADYKIRSLGELPGLIEKIESKNEKR